jgi:hypothetical protein
MIWKSSKGRAMKLQRPCHSPTLKETSFVSQFSFVNPHHRSVGLDIILAQQAHCPSRNSNKTASSKKQNPLVKRRGSERKRVSASKGVVERAKL